ncbi:hypothetical protein [Stenomitos frigidus]|uniref:Uncharacterized protein n=1 Tax=Stenomitos frigidus ULC18 TaxID=2107698 RepID=A0A2T1DVI5_9CYAN|nr:hypothetical protein [Stenomitos frigidus]PSB24508.1 hypothetical protein C7B82_26075 [Stenomitos frigidus ULC18]
MNEEPVFQPGMKVQDTSNARSPQTTLVEQSWLYDKTAPPINTLSNSTLILVPFGLIVLWTIALIVSKLQKKRQRHGSTKEFDQKPHAVPCRHCIFFKNNPYLKCAINPIDALTVNAIDCADYRPQAWDKQ